MPPQVVQIVGGQVCALRDPPDSIANAIPLIWPHRLYAGDVAWPPPVFPNDSFDRLANWDLALRRGVA